MNTFKQIFTILSMAGLLYACGGGSGGSDAANDEPGDRSVATRTSPLPPNDPDCPGGGILVETGIDVNANGLLDNNEVDQSEKVCNGINGLNALVLITPEPNGANCARGGWRVDSGIDLDDDSVLDPGEITSTAYICNANDGQANWRGMETISDNNFVNSDNPQVSLNDNGDGIAVWNQAPGLAMFNDIRASRFDRNLGWTTPVTLDTGNLGEAFSPHAVIDSAGNITAAWTQSDGIRFNIWANRYDAINQVWGTANLIETTNTGDAFEVRMVVDSNGNVYVGWRQFNNNFYQIRGNYFDSGLSAWSGAFDISTANLGDANMGDIAFDSAGNAMFTWQESDGVRINAWSFYTPAGVNTGTAVEVETYNGGNAFAPRVVFDSQGEAIAVWEQLDAGRLDIVSSRFQPVGGWGPSVPIENENTESALSPRIGVDSNDRLLAVWAQENNSILSIYANEYDPVGSWGTPELIEGTDSGSTGSADLAVNASGEAIAVWRQFDPGVGNNVFANRYDPFDGWETEQYLELENNGDALEPKIAINTNGDALTVWKQSDTNFNFTIRSNRTTR